MLRGKCLCEGFKIEIDAALGTGDRMPLFTVPALDRLGLQPKRFGAG
jgi:hypothetical protein